MRKVMALAAAASLLLLSACGSAAPASSGDVAPLESIKVKPGKDDSSDPAVTFDKPLVAEKTAAKVVLEGKGDLIKENQNVQFKSVAYNAEDGALLGSGFGQAALGLPTTDELKKQMPALYETFLATKVGSWIAFVEPDADAAASPSTSATPAPSDKPVTAKTVVVLKVLSASDIPEPSKKLSDDEVSKLKSDGGLPTVEMKDGKPVITIPKGKDAPTGLVVDVLKEGTGKAAEANSDVVANYSGVRWEDGKAFDASYDRGEPTPFNLQQVIAGWTQGLTGLKAGTEVMLTVPGDLAYGVDEATAGSRPAGTLVFFVELKEVK
ncbi:FKBP-type peptidyl-prolyl cis-trans isomerase [Arthrobacter sp. MYb227]|uniref:FKBP-type peptidyl-prolyl cis-trans isomerase n=1 Tax=Arthrobacter sp. MYb227 TaxID=1848601 RepID=UPI0015E44D0C|nr:FKBP-type peptidyl-prolyl cis-trans isomerase [Arthrobacter sp. MYb227]